ncbi:MAG: hypothetical protein JWL90_1778 [Chthoniobacteraceae bacterium]|nr:hypothetical protein [Chthoniobacteraceae bacterium]
MNNRSTPTSVSMPLFGALAAAAALYLARPALAQNATPAAPLPVANAGEELAALKKEVELLKGKVPDQSHAMKDVAYHFTNLWFAGQKQNWPLAKFYCDETRAHLKWAVRIIPIRKVKGGELDLRAMLEGLDQSVFTALARTIEAKNVNDFSATYRQTLDACYACHAAAEKPFLRLHVPEHPEAQIIEFTPAENPL